ncbi:Purine permease [Trema orientale]|uniref:Purine permease n=1 Tax=Trema orientale TaxID=63057 RepID=A0A2P5DL78_TREOI|nr:Purine permease [Trema orientale]
MDSKQPSKLVRAAVYVVLSLIVAADCYLLDSFTSGCGLVLSLTQFSIQKVLKRETLSVAMDIAVYESIVASLVTMVGLFTSGEWKDLRKEMLTFGLGKESHILTLTWTAIVWHVFTIGALGLILEVSSLFSNVMSVLGLPIVLASAVFFFHEKMDGVKVMAMVLAVNLGLHFMFNQNTNREIRASPERERSLIVECVCSCSVVFG